MPNKWEVAGVALAGGLSRRMGEDKALLRPRGAASLLESACVRLSVICQSVYVSTAPGRIYSGFACIEDNVAACGPISGIYASLQNLQDYGAILALACDMPLVGADLLSRLVEAWRSSQNCGMAAWQSRLTGKIQTLAALYSTSSLPFFESALSGGHYGLWDIVPENMRLCLPYGPEMEPCFINCNTRADLAAIDWDKSAKTSP